MRAHTFGRVMGIGLRVAGRVAGQRLAAGTQGAPTPVSNPVRNLPSVSQSASQRARRVGRAAQQGAGGFFRSFRRAGSIVWLQVTGCFFFLPVLAFSPVLWRTRMSWAQGPDHRTFVATAVIVILFFYLGVSSFWRAARK